MTRPSRAELARQPRAPQHRVAKARAAPWVWVGLIAAGAAMAQSGAGRGTPIGEAAPALGVPPAAPSPSAPSSASAPRAATSLPPAADLPAQISAANRLGQPLVVLVSLDGCPYCELVRRSYLLPLVAEQSASVVQVDVRSARPTRHPAGATAITHDELTRTWQARMTPTVLFLGPGGVELAPRLVGVPSEDFYGGYLEDRLLQARRSLQGMPKR